MKDAKKSFLYVPEEYKILLLRHPHRYWMTESNSCFMPSASQCRMSV